MNVQELAGKTADEIERRGLAANSLAKYDHPEYGEINLEDVLSSGGVFLVNKNFEGSYEDVELDITPEMLANCRVCALGGIAAAAGEDPRHGYVLEHFAPDAQLLVQDLAHRVRLEDSDDDNYTVWKWSDSHTQADVVGLLRQIEAGL